MNIAENYDEETKLHFSRNSNFSLNELITQAKVDMDKRFKKAIKFNQSQIPIILHPEVLGKIITYHSSYYLLDNFKNPKSDLRFWKEN